MLEWFIVEHEAALKKEREDQDELSLGYFSAVRTSLCKSWTQGEGNAF